jgi:hypothetical protein
VTSLGTGTQALSRTISKGTELFDQAGHQTGAVAGGPAPPNVRHARIVLSVTILSTRG